MSGLQTFRRKNRLDLSALFRSPVSSHFYLCYNKIEEASVQACTQLVLSMNRLEIVKRAEEKKLVKIKEFRKEATICGMLYTQVLDLLDKEREDLLEAYGFKAPEAEDGSEE